MNENDEHWALVDLLKEIIEDSHDDPHFTIAEHALMGHGRVRDEWLDAHDAEVAGRIARALSVEHAKAARNIKTRYGQGQIDAYAHAARIAREAGKQ